MRYFKILICIILFSISETLIAGNSPCAATILSTNMSAFGQFTTAGNMGSNVPSPTCGNYGGVDFWFELNVGPSGQLYLISRALILTNGAMEIYRGTCQNPEVIRCISDDLCGNTDMPITTFYDLTPNETILIRFWAEASTPNGSFEFYAGEQSLSPPAFTVTGDAEYISEDCIRLTPNTTNQQGCAWLPDPVDFSLAFTHTMMANFGTNTTNGADGICLVYQNNGINICGDQGEGIGAANIPNSLIIEFDTWQNASQNDPALDHTAVNINGNMNHTNSISPVVTLGEIEDGDNHNIEFSWDPGLMEYTIVFDGVVQIQGVYDVVGLIFGGNPSAYWGYTSSTGAATNEQVICPNVERYPHGSQDTVFVQICEGETYLAGGQEQSVSGVYTDIYTNSQLCDSIILTELTVIPESITYIDTVLCLGECIDIAGNIFCTSGNEIVELNSVSSGCDSTVELILNVLTPVAQIDPGPQALNCIIDNIRLVGSNSFATPNGVFFWYGPQGFISDSANIQIGEPGIYKLVVSASLNDVTCYSDTAYYEIGIDTMLPVADAGEDIVITCAVMDTFLDASNSSLGQNFSLQWNFNNNLFSDEIFPEVTLEGIYVLTVFNTENGCVNTDEVMVLRDDLLPSITAMGGELNCSRFRLIISLDTIFDNAEYMWSGPDMFLSMQPTPEVSIPGVYQLTVELSDGCIIRTSASVTIDSVAPHVFIEGDTIISCATPQVQLIGNTSDSVSYLWNTPSGLTLSDSFVYANTEGLYVLTATSANGCTATDSVEVISSDQVPQFSVEASAITCDQSSSLLQVTTSDSFNQYNWVGPNMFQSNLESPLVMVAGYYFLSVTGSSGCVLLDTIHVPLDTMHPEITLMADTITCLNETAHITFSEDSTMLSFLWAGPGSFQSADAYIDAPVPGQYTITVTSANGCQSIRSQVVFADLDTLPLSISAISTLTCELQEFDVYLNSPASANIIWNGPGFDNILSDTISITQSGDYRVELISQNGCQSRANFVVEQHIDPPVVDVNDLTITCDEMSVLVSATENNSYNYDWIGPSNFISDSHEFFTTLPGDYYLTVTSSNFCESIYQVVVYADTASPVISLNDVLLRCNEDTLYTIEDAPPSYDYAWKGPNNFESDQISLIISNPGLYNLHVVNPTNGCIGDFSMLAVSPNVPVIENYLLVNPTCIELGAVNQIEVFGGLPPYRMALDGNAFLFQNSFSELDVGRHSITVQDVNQCTSTVEFDILDFDRLSIDLVPVIELIEGEDSIQLSPIFLPNSNILDSIFWSPSEFLSCYYCPSPYVLDYTANSFAIWAIDTNGCVATAQIRLNVKPELFYIPNSFSPNNDGINDDFRVFTATSPRAIIRKYEIFNRWGDRVYERSSFDLENNDHWWDGKFNDEYVDPDVFIYVIEIETGSGRGKVFKGEIHLIR